MNKKKWPDFIHQEVLCDLARAQQRVALRRLFEMRKRLKNQIQKLADLEEIIQAKEKLDE